MAVDSPSPSLDSPTPAHVFTEMERWNQSRSNVLKTLATFWSFLVMGANDAAYGVSLFHYQQGIYTDRLSP